MGCLSAKPASEDATITPTTPAEEGGTQSSGAAPTPADPKLHHEKKQKRSINVGDFVCSEVIFDPEANQVVDDKQQWVKVNKVEDNELKVVAADGKEATLAKGEVAFFKGPQLAFEDLKNGNEVEFKVDGGDLSRGQIEGQSSSEVCIRPIDGNTPRKSQLWIPREDIRFLYVMVFRASSLMNADVGLTNKSDPYVAVHLQKSGSKKLASRGDFGSAGHDCQMTHWQNDNLDPVWNLDFKFLSVRDVEAVVFTVWDKDVAIIKHDDFLGRAELARATWEDGKVHELTLKHMDNEKPMVGGAKESKIKVSVKLFNSNLDQTLQAATD